MTPEPGRAEVEAASENGKPFDLKDRLLAGMVGGCGCGVKSPEINFHSARCKYAMAAMAYEVIELKDKRLDDQSGAIRELAAEVTSLRAEVERLTRERERLAAQGIADQLAEQGIARLRGGAVHFWGGGVLLGHWLEPGTR